MPALTNFKHEQFCQLLLEGKKSWSAIMKECEYKISQPFFSQLKHSKKIQTRLAELQKGAITEKVMGLSERLELLTSFVRDPMQSKGFRLACLKELHEQTGDKVNKVDVNSSTEQVIRYVEIALSPKTTDINKEYEVTGVIGDELDGLDEFLKDKEESGAIKGLSKLNELNITPNKEDGFGDFLDFDEFD